MKTVRVASHSLEVLFDEAAIAGRIAAVAREIARADLPRLLVVPILKGSFIFAADLTRALHHAGLTPEVDFMMLASYRERTASSGSVEILRDIETDVRGRGVLIVDDILESGRTLAYAKDLLSARGGTVKTCVLLDKPVRRAAAIEADFVGFRCPDRFVVGYGMDMAHAYRELPFVGVVTSG